MDVSPAFIYECNCEQCQPEFKMYEHISCTPVLRQNDAPSIQDFLSWFNETG